MEYEREQLSALLEEWRLLVNKTLETITQLNEDELVKFVDQKAEIINQMMPYRDYVIEADKQLIIAIIKQEQAILGRMEAIKEEAAEWLSKRGIIRSQSQAYNNSYSLDSLFIDRRK